MTRSEKAVNSNPRLRIRQADLSLDSPLQMSDYARMDIGREERTEEPRGLDECCGLSTKGLNRRSVALIPAILQLSMRE